MRREFLQLTIWSLCLTALVAIVAIVGGGFGETAARSLLTVLTVSVYSLLGFCGALLYDKRPGNWLAGATLLASVLGFLVTVGAIWGDWHGEADGLVQALLILLVLAIAGGQACVLEARRRESDSDWVQFLIKGTLIAIGIVAAMLCLVILETDVSRAGYWRLFGVVAVLDVLGTVLIPIVRRLPARQDG
jgi:hypothetical protein